MIALCLNKDNKFTVKKFSVIEDKYKNIPAVREYIDTEHKDLVYVAAFSNEGWLISDFSTQEQIMKLEAAYKEATSE